ncbi:glycosyltransferase [Flavobacteriaceae bacterium]|nr:glycosyltransferase [Flavobacteriaceae bacterium]|tara:strand:- start:1375 stop:2016 length:642 start_codon:yes stop_codon:yes gene_type:complete
MDNISVIIRNKNEEEYIGFAIQSCLDFFKKPEIIIIDNNSTDNSLEIVNLFSDRTDIIVKNNSNYTPGSSINLGVSQASRKYILILSAHAQITSFDFEEVIKNLEQNISVFGKQIPIYKGKKITPRYIWNHFIDNKVKNMFSKSENRYFFHNAFSFFEKSTLIEHPFNESFPGKEDRFWAENIINKGNNFLYNPNLVCNHYYTSRGATWKGIG